MRILFLLLLFLNACWGSLLGQESPKTDVNQILQGASGADLEYNLDRLNQGERFYRTGYYEGSFRAFFELYKHNPEVASLNYKLGVSALLGDKPEEAAGFFLESLPSVADDYYLLLGYAHRARLEYSRARESFEQYNNTLSSWKQKQFRPLLNQLLSDCEFGGANVRDSVPAFVINPGPAVNSYYDEYAAVEDSKNKRIFFVTRRPDYLPDVPVGRDVFEERILEASYVDGVVTEGVENNRLNSRFNSGIAGISPDGETLYVYRGKKRSGQIGLTDISKKRVRKPKPISERIDHKVFKETAFTETEDGVVFFVSDRRDGMGGKDIWTCRRKGSRRFSRPRNMGPVINTLFDEEGVFVTPDGNTLYFSSEGHPGFGGFDIYKVERNRDGDWMHPVNMGQPFNSPFDDLFFFPSSDSLVSLIASSRPGGYGGLDLYKIQKDIRIPFSIAGNISDAESGQALHGQLSLIDTLKREQVLTAWQIPLPGII